MDPATEWSNELLRFDGARSIDVDHLKELLQVHLIYVHDSKSALELRVSTSESKEKHTHIYI